MINNLETTVPTHPRVLQLKPWVRRTITLWVAIVVPSIAYWVIRFLMIVPGSCQ